MREQRINKSHKSKLKKRLSLLVMAIVCFIGTVALAFAAGDPTYVASADKTELKAGDKITITVKSSNLPTVSGVAMSLKYDTSSFRYVESKITEIDPDNGGSGLVRPETKESTVYYTYGYDGDGKMNPDETEYLYTATFEVLKGVKGGNHSFEIINGKYDDIKGTEHNVTSKNVSVHVSVDPDVTLENSNYNLVVGDNSSKIGVKYTNTTDKPNTTYKSNDESIVKVSSDGTLTPVKSGDTTVTVIAFGKKLTANISVKEKKLSLNYAKLVFDKGRTVRFYATAYPEGVKVGTITWKSSNEKVATVDSEGNVTAVGGGEAVITATADGLTASCLATVNVPITGISLDKTSINLVNGTNNSETIKATISPDDYYPKDNDTITWKSSNEKVATVNDGVVTLVGSGDATITAIVDGKSAEAKVNVNVPIKSLTIDKSEQNISIIPNQEVTLHPTINPTSPVPTAGTTITWTSSDNSVATVENGVVKGVNAGNAVITGSLGGKSFTSNVKVLKAIDGLAISEQDTLEITKGENKQLKVTASNSDAEEALSVKWSSSNEKVATVDQKGNVKAVAAGDATITASLTRNANIKAERKIKVVIPIKGVNIDNVNNNQIDVEINKTFTPDITLDPKDTTDKDVTWSSSDESVVNVNKTTGVVTALKNGKATITGTYARGVTVSYTVNVIVPITNITLDKTGTVNLNRGDKIVVTPTITPNNTTEDKKVTYKSSNENVAVIDANGNITAVGKGEATITAKVGKNNVTASFNVKVKAPIKSIKIKGDNLSVNRKSSIKLDAIIDPEDTDDNRTITWTSSDTSVATVDNNGNVKGLKEGTVKITASVLNGKFTDTKEVSVKIVNVSSVELSNMSVTSGDSINLIDYVKINPENATETDDISYKSSNEKVATIKNGKLIGGYEGESDITVTVNGKSATAKVTVKNALNAKLSTTQDKILEYISKGNNSFEGKVNIKDVKYVDLPVAFNNDITSSEKNLVMSKAGSKNIIAKYLDIELLLKDKNNDILGNVTELSNKISITVDVPEDVKKAGRKFSIIRIHNGVADVLADTDDSDDTITFETDKFSTYAIAYENDEVNSNSGISSSNNSVSNPNTSNNVFQYIIMLLASLGVVTGGIYALKKAK